MTSTIDKETTERIAIFPGSFDPFTRGHAAVVESALAIFDRVVIGVGSNISKSSLLTPTKRLRLIESIYAGSDRVEARIYNGMTGDFAREVGAVALVRGIRTAQDLEMERTIATVNGELYPELQSVMLLTPASMLHISSSCVRELFSFGRDVSYMMPEGVDIEEYINQ